MSAQGLAASRRQMMALLGIAGGLTALARWSGGATEPGAGAKSEKIDHYTCSMHPSVKQPGPGKCPICGMDLIPVMKDVQNTPSTQNTQSTQNMQNMNEPRENEPRVTVKIDDARRQLIGVRTAPVIEGPMRSTFRAAGRVTYDESRLTDVSLKIRGWITHLAVSQSGQRVGKGQPLFTMYSPESYNAQQDFLLATQAANASLVRAARQRLHLLDMDDAQIDAVAKKGTPTESISVASPASGFVIEKNVVEGASVEPGMRVYRIAALDQVWIEADVYESDFERVRAGQPVTVTLDYVPGRRYDAKVAYVYPYLDTKLRTGRVRVTVANHDLVLRPGMYANIELAADVGTRLQVPSAAIVYTGPRRLVFVDRGEGHFEVREVRVGAEADGMYEVLSGLAAGDSVAISGVFLLAAEARIRTAATYWSEP